jgi:hypothetical protein
MACEILIAIDGENIKICHTQNLMMRGHKYRCKFIKEIISSETKAKLLEI